jgi:hypothetical protein
MTMRLLPWFPGQMGVPGSESELGLHPEPIAGFGAGNFYYVDGYNGNDTNSGYTPDNAFLTITKAVSMCVAFNHDYVIVMRYPSAGATGETRPIVLNKETMHFIGCNANGASPLAWIAPAVDTAGIIISANAVEVAGFDIRGGTNHGCIEPMTTVGGYVWRAHIHHCEFGWIGAGRDGILVPAASTTDCAHWLIENNRFGPLLTGDGIRIEHNMTRGVIRNNIFRRVPGIGVDVVNQMAAGSILNNIFALPSNTGGKAITLSASTGTGVNAVNVDGNHAYFGDAAMAADPYSDLAGALANDWGVNYQSLTIVLPS